MARETGHLLAPVDLESVLNVDLELLIIGQGVYSRMEVSPDAVELLKNTQLNFIGLPTKEACEKYNQVRLVKRVAAALHLTC